MRTWRRVVMYVRDDGFIICRSCKYADDKKELRYHEQCETTHCQCRHGKDATGAKGKRWTWGEL